MVVKENDWGQYRHQKHVEYIMNTDRVDDEINYYVVIKLSSIISLYLASSFLQLSLLDWS